MCLRARSFAFALAVGLVLAPASRAQDAARTESDLRGIQAEIERVRAQLGRDAAEKNRLARQLRTAEQAVAAAREELAQLRQEQAQRAALRSGVAAEKRRRQQSLAAERAALAGQLRAAYLIGREEPLKLLLNQHDPAQAGRMFAYYSYFGRARATQIARIEGHVAKIDELDRTLAAEQARLEELERAQQRELGALEQARAERMRVLANLQSESRSRSAALQRLREQQAVLEKLLRELRRTVERFPTDSTDAFAKLRGKLAWPVRGRLAASYGQVRAGRMRWEGLLLATERGTEVRSVYHGRVIYADWLAGLGLLIIVDHGDGYLSLYGHNDSLYKRVGERVAAGDVIAAAGDSGGRPRPELYFEIRRAGKPVDPRPWFRSGGPQP
jgi:septal ring factor EnvC (AmiA/AmiB activator)